MFYQPIINLPLKFLSESLVSSLMRRYVSSCPSWYCMHIGVHPQLNVFCDLQVVLKLGDETTSPLPLYVVRGISAFRMMTPLGRKIIDIPEIPHTLTKHGVNALLSLRWGKFKMPENPTWLVTALSTADLLGDEDFILHVAEILHVHPKKLTLASNVLKVVQDRYRLARIVRLAPSKNEKCGHCHDYFGGTHDHLQLTSCCQRKIDSTCMLKANGCPYCGEGWLSLMCCICKTKTNHIQLPVDTIT